VDEIDVRLCNLLILNSRTPYRELADKLGLSLQAVHRRIQVLIEQGVINGFPGGLSISFVDPVVLYIFGTSSSPDMEQVVAELHRDDRTYIVLVCARNYLSIGALLKDHSEIDDYVERARQSAQLSDVIIGLMSATHIGTQRVDQADREKELTLLDYRIMNALKEDARRPVEEVATALNVSAATARRRLARLTEIGAFSASMDWRPSASGQVVSQIHVRLKEGADRTKVGNALLTKNASRMMWSVSFGNLPNFLLLVVWASSMRELNELTARAATEEGVASASPNVVISEHRFDTWIEKLVAQRASSRSPSSSGE
jgi:DNA-binding Lrp family transcriptional regulator